MYSLSENITGVIFAFRFVVELTRCFSLFKSQHCIYVFDQSWTTPGKARGRIHQTEVVYLSCKLISLRFKPGGHTWLVGKITIPSLIEKMISICTLWKHHLQHTENGSTISKIDNRLSTCNIYICRIQWHYFQIIRHMPVWLFSQAFLA